MKIQRKFRMDHEERQMLYLYFICNMESYFYKMYLFLIKPINAHENKN